MSLKVKDGAIDSPVTAVSILNPDGQGGAALEVTQISVSEAGGATPEFIPIWKSNEGTIAAIIDKNLVSTLVFSFALNHVLVVPEVDLIPINSGQPGDIGVYTIQFTSLNARLIADTPVVNNNSWELEKLVTVYRGSAALTQLRGELDIAAFESQLGKTLEQLTSHHTEPTILVFNNGSLFKDARVQGTITDDSINPVITVPYTELALFFNVNKIVSGVPTVLPLIEFVINKTYNLTSKSWTPDEIPAIAGWGFAEDINYHGRETENPNGRWASMTDPKIKRWQLRTPYTIVGAGELPSDLIFVNSVPDAATTINSSAYKGTREYPGMSWPHVPFAVMGGAYAVEKNATPPQGLTYEAMLEHPSASIMESETTQWFVHGVVHPPATVNPSSRPFVTGWHSFKRSSPTTLSFAALTMITDVAPAPLASFQVSALGTNRTTRQPVANPLTPVAVSPNKNIVAMWCTSQVISFNEVRTNHFKAKGGSTITLQAKESNPSAIPLNFRLGGAIRGVASPADLLVSNDRATEDPLNSKYTATNFVAFGGREPTNLLTETDYTTVQQMDRCMKFADDAPPLVLDVLRGGDRYSVYVVFNKIVTGDVQAMLDKAFFYSESPIAGDSSKKFTGVTTFTFANYYTVFKLTTDVEVSTSTIVRFYSQFCNMTGANGSKACGFTKQITDITLTIGTVPLGQVNLRTLFTTQYPILSSLPLYVKFVQDVNITNPINTVGATISTGSWPMGAVLELDKSNKNLVGGSGNTSTPLNFGPALDVNVPIRINNAAGDISAGRNGNTNAFGDAIIGLQFVTFIGANNGTINAAPLPLFVINIPAEAQNVNLRDLFLTANPGSTAAVNVNFNALGDIGSSSTSTYSLSTGVWPVGSNIALYKQNTILAGKGGDGACMVDGNQANATPATNGGPALEVLYPLSLDNGGGVIGGGGGGGFIRQAMKLMGSFTYYYFFPGGAGAGFLPGNGGVGGVDLNTYNPSMAANNGTRTIGGSSPGIQNKGGDLGMRGGNLTSTSGYGQLVIDTIGEAGKAIVGANLITWLSIGTIHGQVT